METQQAPARKSPRVRPSYTDARTRRGTVILSDGTLDGTFNDPVRLNRSRRWPRAATYREAREQSPSPLPVR